MVSNILLKLVLILSVIIGVTQAQGGGIVIPGGGKEADDCIIEKHITFAFNRYDPSNNYTGAYEYWMRKATTCNYLMKQKSKITWYSSDINIKYEISYDLKDG